MESTYRAAIVGAGRKAGPIDDERMPGDRAWLKPWGHASAYQATPGCRLVAVADVNEDKLASFGERYGVPVSARYTDYREMIDRERPDLLSVATWAPLHAEVTCYAAEHGVKAIYCEKALACSMDEADRMLEACRRNGVAFDYGAGRRYRPGYRMMRRLAEEGQLGRVLQYIFNGGAGALMHSLSHAVDTALFLLGDPEPAFVQATIIAGEYDAAANRWDRDPHVAQAYIHFQDGTGAHLCANGARWYTFSLVGTTGLAMAYDNNSAYALRRLVDPQTFRSEEVPFPPFEDESDTLVAIRELITAIENGTPEATRGPMTAAHRGMELLCAMAQSHLQNGARVRLPLENRAMYIPSR
ncbi:MAG: Gfo/Idh/MocA family oxidoreductase [Chloroflexi bacterium]|nr:Gfo/Idh/MocA family oxidoreductase [Chloroflexota bacterium]